MPIKGEQVNVTLFSDTAQSNGVSLAEFSTNNVTDISTAHIVAVLYNNLTQTFIIIIIMNICNAQKINRVDSEHEIKGLNPCRKKAMPHKTSSF